MKLKEKLRFRKKNQNRNFFKKNFYVKNKLTSNELQFNKIILTTESYFVYFIE